MFVICLVALLTFSIITITASNGGPSAVSILTQRTNHFQASLPSKPPEATKPPRTTAILIPIIIPLAFSLRILLAHVDTEQELLALSYLLVKSNWKKMSQEKVPVCAVVYLLESTKKNTLSFAG
jgi:hypothetical protein